MELIKFIANFSILFGIFFLIVQFLFFSKPLSILGLIPIIFGYHYRNKTAVLDKIEEDSVTFSLGKEKVHLSKENIFSVSKVVRFTMTENYMLVITFYNKKKKKKDRYYFMNIPEYNLLESFKNMGVKLENVP